MKKNKPNKFFTLLFVIYICFCVLGICLLIVAFFICSIRDILIGLGTGFICSSLVSMNIYIITWIGNKNKRLSLVKEIKYRLINELSTYNKRLIYSIKDYADNIDFSYSKSEFELNVLLNNMIENLNKVSVAIAPVAGGTMEKNDYESLDCYQKTKFIKNAIREFFNSDCMFRDLIEITKNNFELDTLFLKSLGLYSDEEIRWLFGLLEIMSKKTENITDVIQQLNEISKILNDKEVRIYKLLGFDKTRFSSNYGLISIIDEYQ